MVERERGKEEATIYANWILKGWFTRNQNFIKKIKELQELFVVEERRFQNNSFRRESSSREALWLEKEIVSSSNLDESSCSHTACELG